MIGGMDAITVKISEANRLYAIFHDGAGAPKTGLTVSVRIRRESDGYYLKNDGTWTSSPSTEYTATESSATNLPGVYYFAFTPPATVDKFFIQWDGSASAADRYQYGYLRSVKMNATDLHLMKAVVANKQRQATATGVVQVYDDDASTVLKTLTPTFDGTYSILTPS